MRHGTPHVPSPTTVLLDEAVVTSIQPIGGFLASLFDVGPSGLVHTYSYTAVRLVSPCSISSLSCFMCLNQASHMVYCTGKTAGATIWALAEIDGSHWSHTAADHVSGLKINLSLRSMSDFTHRCARLGRCHRVWRLLSAVGVITYPPHGPRPSQSNRVWSGSKVRSGV